MKILDTTIRDGSYEVDFKFSCDDVAEITSKLDCLGFEYVEIGHGQGLDASSLENGISLHSDAEYMQVANENLKHGKFGFFCIPGIAKLESLGKARKNGMSFVRIGIDANRTEEAYDYIQEAKRQGLEVMVNFMKTYTVSPFVLAKKAKEMELMHVDVVYIVDSAGTMLPQEIEEYYQAIRSVSQIKLGFHGHNNLGLAVSNTIKCVELGFDMIDCTLQGVGRSLGNASTEMVVMTLKKMGYDIEIDLPRLLEYGYVLLRDIMPRPLQNPLDLMCGFTGLHSGYLKDIYKCCNEKHVDPLRLIMSYSQISKIEMNYDKLCEVADNLPRDFDSHPYKFREFI